MGIHREKLSHFSWTSIQSDLFLNQRSRSLLVRMNARRHQHQLHIAELGDTSFQASELTNSTIKNVSHCWWFYGAEPVGYWRGQPCAIFDQSAFEGAGQRRVNWILWCHGDSAQNRNTRCIISQQWRTPMNWLT